MLAFRKVHRFKILLTVVFINLRIQSADYIHCLVELVDIVFEIQPGRYKTPARIDITGKYPA